MSTVQPQPRAAEDEGLSQDLSHRHIRMIAMGSAIGTGLFLGTGSRLQSAGPFLAILYLVCGLFGYFMLRSLGEMIVYRPSSGSFVSYTREFFGERGAYAVGWMYWLFWAMTAVADATAVALYVKWFGRYTSVISATPQWVIAFVALALVLAANLISVGVFGELEFWFSLIKILALVIFMLIGIYCLIKGDTNGAANGFQLLNQQGGLLPKGLFSALIVMQGVVFAYSGIELVGTTAGEAKDARTQIPKAIDLVIVRIIVFYFGSVVLLCLLLPYNNYSANVSPFVTFLDSIGVPAAAPIMQLVVITAALSSLNAGLYSTGRIVRSLSLAGSAPEWAGRLNKSGVPFGGIALTAIVGVLGVIVNFVMPGQAFEVMINMASVGVITCWASICLSHLKFVKAARAGQFERPDYKAPFYPVADYLTLIFLAGVVILMGFDKPIGTWSLIVCVVIVAPALFFGWKAVERSGRKPAANVDFEV